MRLGRIAAAAFAAAALMIVAAGSAVAGEIEVADLVGTWEHVAISKTPDGEREPVKRAVISWTFKADGTGTYHQKVVALNMNNSRPLFWELVGDSIRLYGSKEMKKPSAVYTVIESTGSTMVWKNEKLKDYYHVEKRD